jgi:hypothetical protein
MSEKVYGIAESKSKVEVPRKSDVYSKEETYPKSQLYNTGETFSAEEVNERFLTKADGAPKNHATILDIYGLGTTNKFGHVKLTTSLSAPSGNQDGIAMAGSVGYQLKQYIDTETNICKIPVNGIMASLTLVSNDAFAQRMQYGTWTYLGKTSYADSGSHSWDLFLYMRTA